MRIIAGLRNITAVGIGILITSVATSQAESFTVTFDLDDEGNPMTAGVTDVGATQPYADLFAKDLGVILSTDDQSSFPLNLYDSETVGGLDDDLERDSDSGNPGNWADGNLTNEQVFNLLIVNTNTNLSAPNDRGAGGEMTMTFGLPIDSFGFEFIDLDSSANADLILRDGASTVTIPFADFETGSGSSHDVGASFTNRSGNRVLDIQASELGLTQITDVTFDLSSSGGIGTLFFNTIPVVPEPSVGFIILFATGMLTLQRRRSRGARRRA